MTDEPKDPFEPDWPPTLGALLIIAGGAILLLAVVVGIGVLIAH